MKTVKRLLTTCIVIVAEERMSYFVAGLTNDNPAITAPVYKQYHHVQYDGILPASATASVSFPPSTDTFRYVIIQQKFPNNRAICMIEVKVFLRGTWTSCVILMITMTVKMIIIDVNYVASWWRSPTVNNTVKVWLKNSSVSTYKQCSIFIFLDIDTSLKLFLWNCLLYCGPGLEYKSSTLCLNKKFTFYFWDNFSNCKPIQITFGRNIADKIWNKLTHGHFDICSLIVASLHRNMTPIFLSIP